MTYEIQGVKALELSLCWIWTPYKSPVIKCIVSRLKVYPTWMWIN